jgi:anthraniloyl-CoA monooxygenase
MYEKNFPDDVFGFGVGLSSRTMGGIAAADGPTHQLIVDAAAALTGIELRLPEARLRYDGFGVSAISRHTLLSILREQAQSTGARLHFGQEVNAEELDAEVVVLADGAGSAHRNRLQREFGTSVETGAARYIWLGTAAAFPDAAAVAFVRTEYGPMAAHSYPYGEGMSTVVIELDENTWQAAGLGDDPGPAAEIGDDHLNLLTEISPTTSAATN